MGSAMTQLDCTIKLHPRDILGCVDPTLKPICRGNPKVKYQMGVDVGITSDATVVFVTHVNKGKVIQDYHEVWQAGIPWRGTNPHLAPFNGRSKCKGIIPLIKKHKLWVDYVTYLENLSKLSVDKIADWIEVICQRFNITEGLMDKWNSDLLRNILVSRGLKQFTCEFDHGQFLPEVSLLVKSNSVRLYDSSFVGEVLSSDPPGSVTDAFVRASYLSKKYL